MEQLQVATIAIKRVGRLLRSTETGASYEVFRVSTKKTAGAVSISDRSQ